MKPSPELVEHYAQRIISSRAFSAILMQRVNARDRLSVVRMGDGERQLYLDCAKATTEEREDSPVASFDKKWRERMGIEGITYDQLRNCMDIAIQTTDYYGPSVSGLTNHNYWLFDSLEQACGNDARHKLLVDNFFVNSVAARNEHHALLKAAGRVLFVHRNPITANTFARRAKDFLGVEIIHLGMSSWEQAPAVVEKARRINDAPLVLASCGPGGKWIIPVLSAHGRVAIDLGNAADHWLLASLDPRAKKK